MAPPMATKQLVSSEIENANNTRTEAVIGELVTYSVTFTVPEGVTPNALLQDTLDAGMAFVSLDSITLSSGLTFDGPGTPVVTNSGHTATIDLGQLTNADRNNAIAETITLTYTAVVLNVASNQEGTQLNNRATISYTGGPAVAASAQNVTVIEPEIQVQKSASVDGGGTTGDAGDTITYTITITNPGDVDAFDLLLNDALPTDGTTGFSLISGATLGSVVDTAGLLGLSDFALIGSNTTGYTLQNAGGVPFDFLVNPGRTITLTVTGTISILASSGQQITNTAGVNWTSLDGDPGVRSPFSPDATERTGAGGVNDYRDTDSAVVSIAGDATKSLVSTSESGTPDNLVAVGEVVRYRLQFELAEGANFPALSFLNSLPDGLIFRDDGTARIAFVSNGGILAPSYSDPAAFVVGDNTTISTIVPMSVIPSSQISAGPFVTGTDVQFLLGAIGNLDNDPGQEYVVIEFNAFVANDVANQANRVLTNSFQVINNSGTLFTSPGVDVTVGEPALTVTKLANPQVGDAGDTIAFSVLVRNGSGATVTPAYDVNILDSLPAGYVLNVGSVQIIPLGSANGVTNTSAGNTVNATIGTIPPGAAVLVFYSATLANTVRPNDVLTNTATMTYTSLPGTAGTAAGTNPTGSQPPGASGAIDGERNGSGGINDYTGSDPAQVTVPVPTITKTVIDTSVPETQNGQYDPLIPDLTVGETVTFQLTATFTEGTTRAIITDSLPFVPGILEYTASRVVSIGSNISGSALPVGATGLVSDSNGDGIPDRIVFDFGTVVNAFDNVLNAGDQIVMEVTARVIDIPANVTGTRITNGVVFDYQTGTASASADVEVVEPVLEIDKAVSTPVVDAGDIVTYTVTVRHSAASTGPAFDLVLNDLLQPNLELQAGSVTTNFGTVVLGNSGGDTTIRVTVPALLLGQTLTITYQARIADTAQPGDTVPNLAFLPYDSLPGPGGRPDFILDPATVTVNTNGLSGIVYVDLVRNGFYDVGEPLLAGVPVTLTGSDNLGNPVNTATTTDVNGYYEFLGLRPGAYTVIETQPAFYVTGTDSPGSPFGVGLPSTGTSQLQASIPPGSNSTGTNFNFGELIPNAIVGIVWLDANDNGIFEPGESGIPGVPVTLSGTDDLGPVLVQTVTGPFGLYLFTGLRPGTYTVTETQPTNLIDGQEELGSLGGIVSNDQFREIVLTTGDAGIGYNFGELTPSVIHGFAYIDANNNGTRDAAETGIPGVTVTLTGVDDRGQTVNRMTTTDTAGRYEFGHLRRGTYTLSETQPTAYLDNPDEDRDLLGPAAVVGNDVLSSIVLPLATGRGPFNFGELPPSSIAGRVYEDLNRNGRPDPNEPGIPGVTITLTGVNDLGTTIGPIVVLTDGNGHFQYRGLRPGQYQLVETQPADYVQAVDTPGTAGGVLIATDDIAEITLGPGVAAVEYLFGELNLNHIRPDPVPPLPPLPPFPVPVPDPEPGKREFLGSTPPPPPTRPLTERTVPDFAALGTTSNPGLETTFVATAEAGPSGLVRVFDLTGGQERFRFVPFPGNPGGARVAIGDVNGDFVPDIVTAAGPGGGPRVLIYDGRTGAVIGDFFAFEESFTGGVFVSVGDVDGDGLADVVVSPDLGGGPRVRVLSGGNPDMVLADFLGIADAAFRGGVRTALGDFNGDGIQDIGVAAGIGGGPRVAIWDGAAALTGRFERLTPDFFAFESTLQNGVYLATGDVDGDGVVDLIAGAGPGGAPRAVAFSGAGLLGNERTPIADFRVGDSAVRGGLPLSTVDLDGDDRVEVVTGGGTGTLPWVRFVDPRTHQILDEFAAEWLDYHGGIYVG